MVLSLLHLQLQLVHFGKDKHWNVDVTLELLKLMQKQREEEEAELSLWRLLLAIITKVEEFVWEVFDFT